LFDFLKPCHALNIMQSVEQRLRLLQPQLQPHLLSKCTIGLNLTA
jgi:hypothetical protein